jgi:two-component system phosphate regulon sensor histidine kinase PhoR
MAERRRRRAAPGWTITSHLRRLVLLCWTMLLLVCVAAVGSLAAHSETFNRLTLIVVPARDSNVEVRQAMTDAQTGLEGYQASGNRVLLQPYFGTRDRTMAALATLQDRLAQGAVDETDALRHRNYAKLQRQAVEQWWASALLVEQNLSRGEQVDLYQNRALFTRFSAANDALGDHLTTQREQTQSAASTLAMRGEGIIIGVTLAALLVMLVVGGRISRTISQPLTELRDALGRQGQGEQGAHAREDQGSREMRSLAISFNELSRQNVSLLQTQASALSMNRLAFRIALAIRATSDTRQALDAVCASLGEGLGVDRVIAHTVDAAGKILLGAQWHLPDLPPMGEISPALSSHLARFAAEEWLSEGVQVRNDFLAPGVELNEQAQAFRRETGARAVIMAPIGLGDRVIGGISVITVHEPREWSEAEAGVVRQAAGFAARAINHADEQAHQSEYVGRLERLDQQKSDFLATVSHELRTPLASIIGYLELIQEENGGKLTAQQHKMLEVVDRNTGRLRSLIEDVMMLNRIEGGVSKANFGEVSIHALITRVVEEMHPLARSRGIVLEVDAGPQSAIVLGDKASLDRAVVNVLSNAIKFSHPEGVVTVSGLLDQEARRVLVICQDRGVGIPDRDRGDLFTRFFRASNATEKARITTAERCDWSQPRVRGRQWSSTCRCTSHRTFQTCWGMTPSPTTFSAYVPDLAH